MIIKKGAVYSAVITGLVILVIIVSIIAKADRTPNQVVVTFGEGKKLEIDYGQQEIQYEKILSQIYDNEFAKAGLIDWLAKKTSFRLRILASPRHSIPHFVKKYLQKICPSGSKKLKNVPIWKYQKNFETLQIKRMFHFTMLVNPFE